MGLFSKNKDIQSIKNEWYLHGMFNPEEHLDHLEKKYNKKRNSNKDKILRAEIEGFTSGLEKRNKSRLAQLQKLRESQKNKDPKLER